MYWGAGPALGLLTLLGYFLLVIGAVLFWRSREDFSLWVHDEFGAMRRNLSRHTIAGPFYCPREESRLKTLPYGLARSLSRMPRHRLPTGAILLLIGPLLLLLDFFI
jgi:hypothetical protein